MITISQKRLLKIAKASQKREELAIKVINNPSDNNLVDYNKATIKVANLARDYGIHIVMSSNEKAASKLFLSKKEELINKGYWI